MVIYLFPFIATIISWLFFLLVLKLFLSGNENSSWSLRHFIAGNRPNLAKAVSDFAAQHFLNTNGLSEKIGDPKLIMQLRPVIEQHVDQFLNVKLVARFPAIALLGGSKITDQIKSSLMEELEHLLPDILQKYSGLLIDQLDPGQMISEKLEDLSNEKIYHLIREKLKKHSWKIEVVGALSGFFTGLVLLLVLILFPS